MRPLSDDLAPADRKLLEDVEEFGVHILHVPEEGGQPAYSFTVGLWHSFEQPEVIAFGLPQETAHELLNAVADEADEGRRFLGGEKHEGLLVDYAVRFVDVPKDVYERFLGSANWAYEGSDFPCVQLVWPDKQGRWPWQDGVKNTFRATQPVLGTPKK